jgi:hypothetical protein
MDLIFIGIGVVFFAVLVGFVAFSDGLKGGGA